MNVDLYIDTLDWSNPTVLDFRYIYYLMKMCQERCVLCGRFSTKLKTTNFYPFGLFNIQQLQYLYAETFYMAYYYFFNPENFKEEFWNNGHPTRLPCYTLKDMCEIADFDFFANPLIPGQPLPYYDKFLLPLKKVLGALKILLVDSGIDIKNTYRYLITDAQMPDTITTGKQKVDFYEDINSLVSQGLKQIRWGYTSRNSLGYTVNIYKYSWTEYENNDDGTTDKKTYSANRWQNLVYSTSEKIDVLKFFPPGVPYDIYLYQHTSFRVGVYPFWSSSYWQPIIKCQSGTIPSNGFLEDIEISLPSTGAELNLDIKSEIPIYEFTDDSDATPMKRAAIGCMYSILMTVDISSKLNYR